MEKRYHLTLQDDIVDIVRSCRNCNDKINDNENAANIQRKLLDEEVVMSHHFVQVLMNKIEEKEDSMAEIRNKVQETRGEMQESRNLMKELKNEKKRNEDDIDMKHKTGTYAENLKSKKTLIVKSTDEVSAVNNKKTVMTNIKAQVESSGEMKDGHLIIKFAEKQNLEQAKSELEQEEGEAEDCDMMNYLAKNWEKAPGHIRYCRNCNDKINDNENAANIQRKLLDEEVVMSHHFVQVLMNKIEEKEDSMAEIRNKVQETRGEMQESRNLMKELKNEKKRNEDDIDMKHKTGTYAENLKSKKTLIVKSTDEVSAVNNKKTVMTNIKAQVESSGEMKDGHLIIKFAEKQNLEQAKSELEQVFAKNETKPQRVNVVVNNQVEGMTCYNCKRQGHLIADCRTRFCSIHNSSTHSYNRCYSRNQQQNLRNTQSVSQSIPYGNKKKNPQSNKKKQANGIAVQNKKTNY
ncbi:repetitive organellar protein-like [Palaemon carinicauda]|uniref:repetitive organellar protein-like n=1 Tax=Palaemon carinicauda TaxID=392227 RepID=UPI0035B68B11